MSALPKLCLFADPVTLEPTRKREGKISEIFNCTLRSGIICKKCNRFVCSDCALLIRSNIPKKGKHDDYWLSFLDEHVSLIRKQIVSIDLGHCCEFKIKRDVPTVKQDQNIIKTGKKNQSFSKKRKKAKRHEVTIKKSYSGYIHWLGCKLIVDSPKDGVIDIHGAGEIGRVKDRDYTKGIYHCVLSTECSVRVSMNNVSAKPFSDLLILPTTSVNNFNMQCPEIFPVLRAGPKQIIRVQLVFIPIEHHPAHKLKKGLNNLTDEEIQSCYSFEEKYRNKEIDVTIIVGRHLVYPDSLILLRFHDSIDTSKSFAFPFYNYVMHDIIPGKSGFETQRTGGSSGITLDPKTDGLISFLQSHRSSSPRKVTSLKIVRQRTFYEIHYITPYESEKRAVKFKYSPPQRGGSFSLKTKDFFKFPFLKEFAKCKIAAAVMLSSLHQQNIVSVATKSVNQELSNYNEAACVGRSVQCGKEMEMSVLFAIYNSFNAHSIVCYNVGYHLDVFHQGMASLENKAVFKVHSFSKVCKIEDEKCRGGGDFVGEFYFALLDWGRNNTERRQGALNLGIITNSQTLSPKFLDQCFENNPAQKDAFDAVMRLE